MSTTINPAVVTDTTVLEELANRLFKEVPGKADDNLLRQAASPSSMNVAEQSLLPENAGLQIPYDISYSLPSFSGMGASPSGIKNSSNIPANDFQHTIPANFQTGGAPQSVAGSGSSPSAVYNNAAFNIADPQTSLPDPHFADGKIPQSVAGSGRQPSLKQHHDKDNLPFAGSNSFETELFNALTAFNTFNPLPQVPVTGFGSAAYYFLEDQNARHLLKLPAVIKNDTRDNHSTIGKLHATGFDANLIKKDFPILSEKVNDRQLIWLDNAATTQKPKQVIDRISYFYEHENSNIHRAAHDLAAKATDAYEGAREKVRQFLNAKSTNEIVFVRGATEAINVVAKSWGEQHLQPGDEIIVSHLEHHANIVPWQQLAQKKNLKIKVIPVDDDGQLLLEEYSKLLSSKTKLVAFTQVSNALGTVTRAAQITSMAHAVGAKVLVDGAQSVSHMRVDVQSLNADWFVFSGHKVFAPTGIGVLYGKEELLNATDPWQGGGNMIQDVTFEHTKYHKAPGRFEAGTGNIADAVGLGAAIDYVSRLGIDLISQYEHYLLRYGTTRLKEVKGLKLIGTAAEKASVLSFILDGFTNDEVGQALNKEGIAVRTGHHCAQPILRRFGLESTVRPSLAFYNSCSDIDALVLTLQQLQSKKK